MLDKEGYRPNVGIILSNSRNQVFWGKRLRTHSWQFPQGGIKPGETPTVRAGINATMVSLPLAASLAANAGCETAA